MDAEKVENHRYVLFLLVFAVPAVSVCCQLQYQTGYFREICLISPLW